MSIRKGDDWGGVGRIPVDARTAASDREAADIVAAHRRANTEIPPIVLTGGDLARTLGGRGETASDTGTLRTSCWKARIWAPSIACSKAISRSDVVCRTTSSSSSADR